jgi:hypothetical protein
MFVQARDCSTDCNIDLTANIGTVNIVNPLTNHSCVHICIAEWKIVKVLTVH